ncbi:MAG: PDZ domain-containing protein [Gammaproteobacteria bacterium]|nr:PDZ domain-containing protein [Gammaproteobacteria bacterium]
MKLIKIAGFIFQFTLIGLGVASIYILFQSDRNHEEVFAFLSSSRLEEVSSNRFRKPPVFSYAEAVSSSSPSVVTVYTSKQVKQKTHPLFSDPIFNQFFSDQLKMRERTRIETNLGSGVIINADGYIITNQHVIDGADEILISLPDGRGSSAILVGEDKETDIAILKIQMKGLVGIKIAESDLLRVGDIVLAIGNPLNVGQTVTLGIISATGRNRIGLNTFENFIQTDAAINPGNSGGALVNARGELIGINTAIFSQSGGAQGIGFAIPLSIALDIMQRIIRDGKVTRGWLGVEGTEITAKAAMETGNPNIEGALIVGVFINSPADQAGIQTGDILIAVDGKPVKAVRDLLEMITLHQPGDEIQVEVQRGPKQMNFKLVATERPR